MAHAPSQAIVIGGGPAGLMAAERLALAGAGVSVYERMPTLGRKFLMAGRGGLNLTHGESMEQFVQRYDASGWMEPALATFPPHALRQWAAELGEPTFEGSSGRIFPKSFKASPLLRAWLRRLDGLGVRFFARHRLTGLKPGLAEFSDGAGKVISAPAKAIVLAMGGASWGRLGSDGSWATLLRGLDIGVMPLRPANCGLDVAWSSFFRERFAGVPLKTIALTHLGVRLRGSATISGAGLEGGIVYSLSRAIRDDFAAHGSADVRLDLRPDVSEAELGQRLSRPRGKTSLAGVLRKAAGLEAAGVALVQETHRGLGGAGQAGPAALAGLVKALPLPLTGISGLERAISTAGGICRDELDAGLMLRRLPGIFAAGEMLDWEAPTGGYLLQACFATGHVAGDAAAEWIRK